MARQVTTPVFTFDSREGTLKGPGGIVRLEPKVMAVLEVLSGRRGTVVQREELLDEVWPGVVVTDYTLNRCIYRLRRALALVANGEADAKSDLIETLPKRGYRLLADVEKMATLPAKLVAEPAAPPPPMPYVVGQWVRGDRFYGRAAQIAEILQGQRDLVWLLGTRRIGKTSLLKQIELVSGIARDPAYFPVYWDFQGVDTPDELHLNFNDALLDVEERLERAGIDAEAIRDDDLFVSLDRLRRQLRSRNLKLLLLCDEVEELIRLQREDPSLLRKLRHATQSHESVRTVLASTIRLWALAEYKDDTSPFLHGFTPPVYIERMSDSEALDLVQQSHLGEAERPDINDHVARIILDKCDNHPYLLQLVCKRYVETGSLDEAIDQVATDRMVSYFFSVDFEMLSASERDIVHEVAGRARITGADLQKHLSLSADEVDGSLRRLENLAYVRHGEDQRVILANYFFRRWLSSAGNATAGRASSPPLVPASAAGDPFTTGDNESRFKRVLSELKRRKVFRVGVVYVVVSWLLLQVGDIVFDFLEVPAWAGKLLLAILGLGLPLALILAWAFELTPGGIIRDKPAD